VMADHRDIFLGLLRALQRAQRKAQPLIANPALLDQEEGEDALDVICMQFLAAGESLKRLNRMISGMLKIVILRLIGKALWGFAM